MPKEMALVDDKNLKYHLLARFDRDMNDMSKSRNIFDSPIILQHENSTDKVLIFRRAGLIFAFNFHPTRSYTDYQFDAPPGKYMLLLDTDAQKYGGYGIQQPDQEHFTIMEVLHNERHHKLSLYLPARSALVLFPS